MKLHNDTKIVKTFDRKIWEISLFFGKPASVAAFVAISVLFYFIKNEQIKSNMATVFAIVNVLLALNTLFLFRLISVNMKKKYGNFLWMIFASKTKFISSALPRPRNKS